jgi:hypothetical protein
MSNLFSSIACKDDVGGRRILFPQLRIKDPSQNGEFGYLSTVWPQISVLFVEEKEADCGRVHFSALASGFSCFNFGRDFDKDRSL